MAELIGHVEEFNQVHDDFELCRERLEQYFCANKISNAKVQSATLLSVIRSATYKLVRDLCYPDLPKDTTYKELCDMLKQQFGSHTSVWRERIRFYESRQEEGESAAEWYARLKSLAVNCEFGSNLECILKDKLICGLMKGKLQNRLCEENKSKSLEEYLKIAIQKDLRWRNKLTKFPDSGAVAVNRKRQLNALSKHQQRRQGENHMYLCSVESHRSSQQMSKRTSNAKWPSVRRKSEKFGKQNKVCGTCSKVHEGQQKYVKTNKNSIITLKPETINNSEPIFPVQNDDKFSSNPFTIKVNIENKEHLMDIDSGASLKPNARTVFCKPRNVPFAYKTQLEEELDRLENAGVITRVDSSAYGTPLVVVVKTNGKLRVCGDYKSTITKYIEEVTYPLPKMTHIFSKLHAGEKFSKIDLSHAYSQFELTEETKKLLTWSTHRGLYQVNRMPYGISPGSALFQKHIPSII